MTSSTLSVWEMTICNGTLTCIGLMSHGKINKLAGHISYSEIVSNDVEAMGWFHQISEPLRAT